MPSTDDPFEDPEFKAFAGDVREKLIPMLKDSSVTVALLTGAEPDVKQAVELGYMVLMDKPIALVVYPGVKVNDHLVRLADAIIEHGPGMEVAINEFVKTHGKPED